MTHPAPSPSDLLPLHHAQFYILVALADKQRHGYDIMKEVTRMTDGGVTLSPTSLYRAVKRTLEAGLVRESDERPDPKLDDERRRYYRLTEFGRKVLSLEAARLETLARKARSRLLLNDANQTPRLRFS